MWDRVVTVSVKAQREAAEQSLGIQAVYDAAQASRNALDETLTLLADARDKRRNIEGEIADHETVVIQSVWVNNPELAQTRLDKLVKNEINQAKSLRDLRTQLNAVISEIEGLEYDKQMHETDIRIACSRMTELNGYLVFIASLMSKQ